MIPRAYGLSLILGADRFRNGIYHVDLNRISQLNIVCSTPPAGMAGVFRIIQTTCVSTASYSRPRASQCRSGHGLSRNDDATVFSKLHSAYSPGTRLRICVSRGYPKRNGSAGNFRSLLNRAGRLRARVAQPASRLGEASRLAVRFDHPQSRRSDIAPGMLGALSSRNEGPPFPGKENVTRLQPC